MDITLKDLLAEIRNLAYLFYGYTIIWAIVLAYMYSLSRRERNLRDQVDELQKMIEADRKQ